MAGESSSSRPRTAEDLNEDTLVQALSFLTNRDRGAAAVVNRNWLRVERGSRNILTLNNCYAAEPGYTVVALPGILYLTVKGKPRFGDFGAFPANWGAQAETWINAARTGWPNLKTITFKRMAVSDHCINLIATQYQHLEALRLILCDGFTTAGLARIAQRCSMLRELHLEHTNNRLRIPHSWNDHKTPTTYSGASSQMTPWLSYFPETFTRLEVLNISCLVNTEQDFRALVQLVSRCRELQKLRLSNGIDLDKVAAIVRVAPNLVELGVGRIYKEYTEHHIQILGGAIAGCNNLRRLYGNLSNARHYHYLPAFNCIRQRLTYLNLYEANLPGYVLRDFIRECHNLETLWVMDLIRDEGLAEVATSCTKLRELRVFPHNPKGAFLMTEKGLLHVCAQCPDLAYILYWCCRMTNAVLTNIAQYRAAKLTCLRLGIRDYWYRDQVKIGHTITEQPFDEGFGAIVRRCTKLKRLSLGGYLTDRVFKYIGEHAKSLEMLSTAFAGETERGLDYILRGCTSLTKMDIRCCPFGHAALLSNTEKLMTMRSLFMSGCTRLTVGGCRQLSQETPGMVFEIIMNCTPISELKDNHRVDKLFVYRTITGPRSNIPSSVRILWAPINR